MGSAWRRGEVARWRRGDVATWRRGGVAAWRRGSVLACSRVREFVLGAEDGVLVPLGVVTGVACREPDVLLVQETNAKPDERAIAM